MLGGVGSTLQTQYHLYFVFLLLHNSFLHSKWQTFQMDKGYNRLEKQRYVHFIPILKFGGKILLWTVFPYHHHLREKQRVGEHC